MSRFHINAMEIMSGVTTPLRHILLHRLRAIAYVTRQDSVFEVVITKCRIITAICWARKMRQRASVSLCLIANHAGLDWSFSAACGSTLVCLSI